MSLNQYQKNVKKGEILFLEGEVSDETYLLLNGEVEIIKGDEVITKISDQGTFIGEMGTLLNAPRSATVKTSKDSLFIVIRPVDFEKVIAQQPSIAFKLCKVLAERLNNTTCELIELKSSVNPNWKSSNVSPKEDLCQKNKNIKQMLQEADELYKEKEYLKSLEILEDILKDEKNNVEALARISNCFFARGNLDKAVKYMEDAVGYSPDNVKLRNNLAVFYFKNKKRQKAIREWEQIIKIDPENKKALSNLKKLNIIE